MGTILEITLFAIQDKMEKANHIIYLLAYTQTFMVAEPWSNFLWTFNLISTWAQNNKSLDLGALPLEPRWIVTGNVGMPKSSDPKT